MTRPKNLDTLIKSEKKYIHTVQSYIGLLPAGTQTVQLDNGTYTQIEREAVAVEKDDPSSYLTRLYDPANPKDAEILSLVEMILEQNPGLASDARYQLAIIGEHQASVWPGYDKQTAEELAHYWNVMPEEARPPLEGVMKYELARVDEDGKSITNQEKVRVLNDLYKDASKGEKVAANTTVDLA